MAVGKIASSTANYGTLGKTSVKNSANGFNDTTQFTKCEVFAPSLNLGVSVINTVAPATQGYTSYTQGPGIEGGVGYAPDFTENNITIIKPDSLPTNPAFADGRKFDRYQTSMLDMARGLQTSVIIGGDLFTTQNFYQGGLNTPNSYYMSFTGPMNIVGQQNFVGTTATMDGYPNQGIGYINVVGTNNYNLPKRSDGNFAFIYPDYGYTLGYGGNIYRLNVFGNDNFNGLVTDGYNAPTRSDSLVFGNSNFSSAMNTSQAFIGPFGLIKPKRQYVNDTIIIGNHNGYGRFENANNYDGTYGQYPNLHMYENMIMGHRAWNNYMINFIPAGAGSTPSDRTYYGNFVSNVQANFTNGAQLRNKYEDSGNFGGYGQGYYTFENLVHTLHSPIKASNSQRNITIGSNIFHQDDSNSQSVAGAFADLLNNVAIGHNVCKRHGLANNNIVTRDNTMIGNGVQQGGSTGLNNCTIIGRNAQASATNAANEITLGNGSISALRCNVTSITALSDARDKTNIEPISNASAFIKDLKPVKFDWNRRDGVKGKEHDMGFLAQDLDDAQSKHGIQDHLDIVYKSNPEALEASYGKLLPILVQALKEQQEEIEKLKSTTN